MSGREGESSTVQPGPGEIAILARTEFARAINDEKAAEKRNMLSHGQFRMSGAIVDDSTPESIAMTQAELIGLMMTSINGSSPLPEQTVTIEYVRRENRLIIPYALGMHWDSRLTGIVAGDAVLQGRYRRCAGLSFREIENLLDTHRTSGPLIAAVEARDDVQLELRVTTWFTDQWKRRAPNAPVPEDEVNMTMGTFSRALGFNCDMRDLGALLEADMTLSDSAWAAVGTTDASRLNNKLQPTTLQCMAALNYAAVNSLPLAAWTRALGVGVGILPDANSLVRSEVTFRKGSYHPDAMVRILQYQESFEDLLMPTALNLIAMFGLFHLNKDHTFKSSDSNMQRIGVSYLNTLRTGTNDSVMEHIRNNHEVYVRTCQHPFGLAQPYWVALMLYRYNFLTTPLRARIDTSPPPVQRVMVVEACAREWANLPAGVIVNELYEVPLNAIKQASREIKDNPPAYSGLFRLYGVKDLLKVPPAVEGHVAGMMPLVYGYVSVMHVDEKNQRDGLGYAQCLKNQERDSKGSSMLWKTLWENYMSTIDTIGLVKFLTQSGVAPPSTGGA